MYCVYVNCKLPIYQTVSLILRIQNVTKIKVECTSFCCCKNMVVLSCCLVMFRSRNLSGCVLISGFFHGILFLLTIKMKKEKSELTIISRENIHTSLCNVHCIISKIDLGF